MGLIADVMAALVPQRKAAISASVPIWQDAIPQYQRESYERLAREGYGRNELVYAAIEERATSAAEPRLVAYVRGEPADDHPALRLFERPNPYMDRYALIATLILYHDVAGNAYLEKVRSRSGKLVELWAPRPDRVRVIPDRERYIAGYEYRIGDVLPYVWEPRDVIHWKTRHPYNDFYGLPPLAVVAERVDIDGWMRSFVSAFFRNAGVPAGLLNIKRTVDSQERTLIQARFREDYGGPAGWHRLLVIDGGEVDYQQLGMPLGERGLVMPELLEINEARVVSPFGVPLQLLGTRLGMASKYANWHEARVSFWNETLIPLYRDLAACLTLGLRDDFPDLDYLEFDLADVEALQEDEDARHKRVREDLLAGVITREEARIELGREPEADSTHTWLLPTSVISSPVAELESGAEPSSTREPVVVAPAGDQVALGRVLLNIDRLEALGELEAAAQLRALVQAQYGQTLPEPARVSSNGGR